MFEKFSCGFEVAKLSTNDASPVGENCGVGRGSLQSDIQLASLLPLSLLLGGLSGLKLNIRTAFGDRRKDAEFRGQGGTSHIQNGNAGQQESQPGSMENSHDAPLSSVNRLTPFSLRLFNT
jgi:hypothetical protein